MGPRSVTSSEVCLAAGVSLGDGSVSMTKVVKNAVLMDLLQRRVFVDAGASPGSGVVLSTTLELSTTMASSFVRRRSVV